MLIIYTEHAVQRMLERNITPEIIRSIIEKPDGTIKQSFDKYIFYKKVKGRKDNKIAIVTVKKAEKSFEVITVMINFEVIKW